MRTWSSPLVLLAGTLLVTACSGTGRAAPPRSPSATATLTTPAGTGSAPLSPTAASPSVGDSGAGLSPPAVPRSGAYLGAWVNPAHQAAGSSAQRAQVTDLAAGGVRPAVLTVYTAFGARPPLDQLRAVERDGAIPLISWGCTSTAAVASGQDDPQIRAYAETLKGLGAPVFLRWFWEMNLRSAAHAACLGSGGAAGFIAAWDHLRSVFAAVGARNVAFVWCPGLSSGLTRLGTFFPGAAALDWIGIDGYAHGSVDDLATVFGAWYARYAGDGRPLMIAETGAEPAEQPAYLASIGSELPDRFPQLKAVVYFDAPGPEGSWQLTEAGRAGLARLAASGYFVGAT